MLGRDDHEGHAVERIGARGVHTQFLAVFLDLEIDERAGRLADPVLLLQLDIRQVVDLVQPCKQLVGIFGDAEIPDLLGLLHDLAVADVAMTALRILIGQNDLAARAIVDQRLVAEDQSVLVHLEEDPLRPVIVVLVGRVNHARPVKGKADAFQLIGELLDVVVRDLAGVNAGLDRGILGRQTVGVKADRKQDIVALQAALAADDLKPRICLDVSDVHARARGVREFDKRVKLRLFAEIHRFEGVVLLPVLLPLGFD